MKEKLLAALRGGIRTVLIPEENRKDLADIPKTVTDQIDIIPVRWIDEVLDLALEHPIAPSAAKKDAKKTTRPVAHKAAKPGTANRREERKH